MVRHDQQGGALLLRQRPVLPQQAVDLVEVGPGHRLVALEVGGIDAFLARRGERREHVADRVRALEVHDGQRRPPAADPLDPEPMVEPRLDQDARERRRGMRVRVPGRLKARELLGRQPRQIRLERGERDLLLHLLPHPDHPVLLLRGEDRARGRLLADVEREQAVRHHQPADRLGRVRGPHRHDGDVLPLVAGHLPDGLLLPLVGGDGLPLTGLRVETREVEDPVPKGADSGHHRGPHERRQVRLERAQDAGAALPHQPIEVRHRPVGPVLFEQLPVRGVEPDHDHPALGSPDEAPVGPARRHDADEGRAEPSRPPPRRAPPRVDPGLCRTCRATAGSSRLSLRRCSHRGRRV